MSYFLCLRGLYSSLHFTYSNIVTADKMCGICGFAGFSDRELLDRMMKALHHRGPDEEGSYETSNISLGHKRLSIIDLKTGSQPIFNEDRSICIVFNGEIYNYKDLRKCLENNGHRFYTQTDTEVIVHLFEEEGIGCVRKLNGEFAFCLFDIKKESLFLVRDRLGIRPLYYWQKEDVLIFASGIKPILLHSGVSKDLDPSSLDAYLTLRYIPADGTMFKEIKRLPPASILTFSSGKAKIDGYWKIEVLEEVRKDFLEEFSALLEDSVRLRMVSDVPLSCFLSGGVDSSMILSIMRKYSSLSLKTFSIGFGTDIDETDAARRVSELLETDHQEIIIEKQS